MTGLRRALCTYAGLTCAMLLKLRHGCSDVEYMEVKHTRPVDFQCHHYCDVFEVYQSSCHGQLSQPINDPSASWLLVAGMIPVAEFCIMRMPCGLWCTTAPTGQRPTRIHMLRCPRTNTDGYLTSRFRQNGTYWYRGLV